MRWRALGLFLAAVTLVVVGWVYLPYIGWNNSRSEARQRAEAYLIAVVGDSEDRGWTLLTAPGRGAFESEDAYRRLMAAADWSHFEWELRDNGICDDGICSFLVHLPNGSASAPDVAWSGGPGKPGFMISIEDRTADGQATLEVLQRGWFGGTGVMVYGVGSGK